MLYKVIYRSRYYTCEGYRSIKVQAESRKSIRDNWHSIINTDEYKIVRIEVVK